MNCISCHSSVKLKFHWDQFPRNFPVANVTGKSPTSYEEVGDVANKSARKLRGNWSQWNLSLNQLVASWCACKVCWGPHMHKGWLWIINYQSNVLNIRDFYQENLMIQKATLTAQYMRHVCWTEKQQNNVASNWFAIHDNFISAERLKQFQKTLTLTPWIYDVKHQPTTMLIKCLATMFLNIKKNYLK